MQSTRSNRRWSRRVAAAGAAAALTVGAVAVPGTAVAAATRTDAFGWPYADPSSPYGQGSTSSATAGLDTTDATASQSTGLVLVSSTVDFGAGEAAGTGMVIDSSGIVVTNHHVVEGATEIEVTVESTGATYTAEVLGSDARRDVAVLKLEGAPTLQTVTPDAGGVTVDQAVTSVGDAGGDGGALTAAPGAVTARHSTITVQDDAGGTSRLRNLVAVDADVVPGDSGGALLDADGEVVGMNVAASSGTADITGYAIPIARVLRVENAVLTGDAHGSVRIGQDGMLGVQVAPGDTGPMVVGVLDGSPAADAGLAYGGTITAVAGRTVSSAAQLSRRIAAYDAGDTVVVHWTDSSGQSHQAEVTLAAAPVA